MRGMNGQLYVTAMVNVRKNNKETCRRERIVHKWIGFVLLAVSLGLACACAKANEPNDQVSSPKLVGSSPHLTPVDESNGGRFQNADDKLIRKDGWKLPALTGADVSKRKSTVDLGRTQIFRTEYELNHDFVMEATRPIVAQTQSQGAEVEHWAVRYVVVFEHDDKPFCYFLKAARVQLNADGSIQDRVATAVGLYIYDKDGDGVFEALDFGPIYPESPELPQ